MFLKKIINSDRFDILIYRFTLSHVCLLIVFCASAFSQSSWLNQDLSNGYGILKIGGKKTIGRFGGGSWGKINGADFDGDGDIDLIASFGRGSGAKGTYSGLFVYQNIGSKQDGLLNSGFKLSPDEEMPFIGDANFDSRPDIYCNGQLFINISTPNRLLFAKPEPYADPRWPLSSVCDWNGDGVLDSFFNSLWHLIWTNGKTGQPDTLLVGESTLLLDIFIHPFPCDWDDDGDLDILVGQESGHITFIENKDGFLLKEIYVQQQNPNMKSGCLSIPVVCDWEGDGDMDIIIGNAAGFLEFFEYSDGYFKGPQRLQAAGKEIRVQAGEFGSVQGPKEARWGYICPEIADWDMDGDMDLLAGCVTGENLYYENIGTRTEPKLASVQKLKIDWGKRLPVYPEGLRYEPEEDCLITQWRCKPVVIDWNRDGLPDYLTIDHAGHLACYYRIRRQDGRLGLLPAEYPFLNEKNQPLQFCSHQKPGRNGRIKFALVDWDKDGDLDIIRNGGFEHGETNLDNSCNFIYLECIESRKTNKAVFKWQGELIPSQVIRLQGHTDSPFPLDIDGNGTVDIISGCEDGNIYYFLREWIEGKNRQ